MKKKILALVCSAAIAATFASGCTKSNVKESGIDNEYGKGEISYPIKTDKTLTYWTWLNPNLLKSCSSLNESPFAEDLQKQTGIGVQFIQPAVGQETESFNILFSSSDLPDIICNAGWRTFSGGGPDGAINSGYIFDMTDYLEDYAPNYYKVLKSDPDLDKAAKSLTGKYYEFGGIGHSVPTYGMIVREDWLKDLNLSKPETIDEWYTVLKAFKEKKGAEAPLAFAYSNFYTLGVLESAYKTSATFFVDNNTVKYGPYEPEYKAFVKEMAKWYAEGLLDKNIASTDQKALDAKILNDNTGATCGYVSSGIGKWMNARKKGSKMELVAAKYPVLNKGDEPACYVGSPSTYRNYAAVSAVSENKELAMRLLDYAFTEKGSLLYNYGREGVTYNMVNGKPEFTDTVLNNSEGMSISEVLYCYAQNGSFKATNESFLQQLELKEQFDAAEIWGVDLSHCPPPTYMEEKEQKEYANIMVDIDSYVNETTLGVICGRIPAEKLDEMDARLKELKIERALEIQQKALNTYNK